MDKRLWITQAIKNTTKVERKILGAGGEGFVLFFVKPKDRDRLRQALGFLLHIPFRFDTRSSQIFFCNESEA